MEMEIELTHHIVVVNDFRHCIKYAQLVSHSIKLWEWWKKASNFS